MRVASLPVLAWLLLSAGCLFPAVRGWSNVVYQDYTTGVAIPASDAVAGTATSYTPSVYWTTSAGSFLFNLSSPATSIIKPGGLVRFSVPAGVQLVWLNYAYGVDCLPDFHDNITTAGLTDNTTNPSAGTNCSYLAQWAANTTAVMKLVWQGYSSGAYGAVNISVPLLGWLHQTVPYPPTLDLTFDTPFGHPSTYAWGAGDTATAQYAQPSPLNASLDAALHLGVLTFNGASQFVDLTAATGGASVGAVLPALDTPSPAGIDRAELGYSVELTFQWLVNAGSEPALVDWVSGSAGYSLQLVQQMESDGGVLTVFADLGVNSTGESISMHGLQQNAWYHLVVTVNRSSEDGPTGLFTYLNGCSWDFLGNGSNYERPYAPATVRSPHALLGHSNDPADPYFAAGQIDTLRVYAFCMNASLVQTLYSLTVYPFGPPSAVACEGAPRAAPPPTPASSSSTGVPTSSPAAGSSSGSSSTSSPFASSSVSSASSPFPSVSSSPFSSVPSSSVSSVASSSSSVSSVPPPFTSSSPSSVSSTSSSSTSSTVAITVGVLVGVAALAVLSVALAVWMQRHRRGGGGEGAGGAGAALSKRADVELTSLKALPLSSSASTVVDGSTATAATSQGGSAESGGLRVGHESDSAQTPAVIASLSQTDSGPQQDRSSGDSAFSSAGLGANHDAIAEPTVIYVH